MDWHTDRGIIPEPEVIVPIGSAINKTDKPDGKKQGTVWAGCIDVILSVCKVNSLFCVTSSYAVWHIGIALSPHLVASLVSVGITLSIPDSISKIAWQIKFKFGMWM